MSGRYEPRARSSCQLPCAICLHIYSSSHLAPILLLLIFLLWYGFFFLLSTRPGIEQTTVFALQERYVCRKVADTVKILSSDCHVVKADSGGHPATAVNWPTRCQAFSAITAVYITSRSSSKALTHIKCCSVGKPRVVEFFSLEYSFGGFCTCRGTCFASFLASLCQRGRKYNYAWVLIAIYLKPFNEATIAMIFILDQQYIV